MQFQTNNINKVRELLYTIFKYSFNQYFEFGSVSPFWIWGKKFVLGLVQFNRESMGSIFLHIIPTLPIKMTHTWSSSRSTKELIQIPMITNGWYPILGYRHYQVHQAALLQLGSCVGRTTLALQVHPRHLSLDGHFRPYASLYRSTFNLRTYLYILLKLSIASHHLFGLLHRWSPCRDNVLLFILFLLCLNIYVSSLHHAFMNLCIYLYTSTSSYFPLHFIPEY